MEKIIRITTIPLSLEKLLEGQLTFMNSHYEVIAVAAEKERLQKYGKDNGVRTFHVELTREVTPTKDLKAVWKLYRFLKKEQPKIVHTHTPKAGIVGMMAAKMAGVPIRLHTVAGLPLLETKGLKRRVLNAVEKATYRFATRIYPNSKGLREIILQEGFVKPEKIKILGEGSSNGIDTHYFDPGEYSEEYKLKFRKAMQISTENFVFIFIGRLVTEKGINELVKAFAKLYEMEKDITLLLVGPFEENLDPLFPEVIKTIKEHPAIVAVGFQPDVRPYLAIADALAFPSYREGFPNVVMQAGAMEIPAIVTDINGCNEIVQNGKNGLLIPPKDEIALFRSMKRIAGDKELTEKLKKRSRSIVSDNYERSEFWELLLREYKELEDSV